MTPKKTQYKISIDSLYFGYLNLWFVLSHWRLHTSMHSYYSQDYIICSIYNKTSDKWRKLLKNEIYNNTFVFIHCVHKWKYFFRALPNKMNKPVYPQLNITYIRICLLFKCPWNLTVSFLFLAFRVVQSLVMLCCVVFCIY